MANILIAEDDHNISDLLCRLLTRLGHSIQVARDGLAALAHLDTQPVDLLITDINLPELSGLDLIERVKTSPARPRIVVCSGMIDQSRKISLAADRVLPKPFMLRDLQDTLAELLPQGAAR